MIKTFFQKIKIEQKLELQFLHCLFITNYIRFSKYRLKIINFILLQLRFRQVQFQQEQFQLELVVVPEPPTTTLIIKVQALLLMLLDLLHFFPIVVLMQLVVTFPCLIIFIHHFVVAV